ncbi:MAG: nuclear transport factor 2 family protein [Ilumatobacteraceae bacterium]
MTSPPTDAELGDRLPAALAEYFEALDDGRPAAAAATFAADAVYAVPVGGGPETDARAVTVGGDAIAARFVERGAQPYVHDVLRCARDHRDVGLEGVIRDRSDGRALMSFAATAQLGDDGSIVRYLAFSSPVVPPPPATDRAGPPPGAAIEVVDRYFRALGAGRFEDAAACFSPDVMYSHPPDQDPSIAGPGRAEFNGREELTAAFHRRGRQEIAHTIVFSCQAGADLLLEGVVGDADGGLRGSFVSAASLDADGLIRRYVAWYTQPGVARR